MVKKWWHGKVAYQIYPKSFYDTNGDGIGDLKGIIEKLDYLKALGIDIIWLSPVYQSPFIDQGYDISDYYKIAEEFGTMEELEQLIYEMKKRGMYLIMDLVINHCSDQHEWFQKALSDPEGEYGTYFYFKKGKNGGVPNNWRSYFGGSVWEPVPNSDYYYFHAFAKEQPDLNWNNEIVRKKLYEMVNWWLEKGLAGFRIDAIMNIKKDINFPDYEPDGADGMTSVAHMIESVDGIQEYLQELKRETFEKYDAFTVGEVFNQKEGTLAEFIGEEGCFSSIFDFSQHVLLEGEKGWYDTKPLDLEQWKETLYHAQMESEGVGFYATILENHDEPRSISRFLPDYAQNSNGAKALGTISFFLRGIPFIYQGQEIGMTNWKVHSIDEYDDISTKDQYKIARNAGLTEEEALEVCYYHSRDNARTPMQWNSEEQAGFTKGNPWLPVNEEYRTINVEAEEKDENSLLHYYQKLTALRKKKEYNETFQYGKFVPMYEDMKGIVAYYREDEENRLLVVANLNKSNVAVPFVEEVEEVLISNESELIKRNGFLWLKSCQAVVLKVK